MSRYRRFDGPDRAVHFARRWGRHRRRGQAPMFFGLAVLALGVLFLLDNLNVIEARGIIRTFWPVLILAWGAARLLFGWGGERVIGLVAMAFGGLLLGNRLFDWGVRVWEIFWPLAMITIGLHIVFQRRRQVGRWNHIPDAVPPPPPGAPAIDAETVRDEPDDEVDAAATFKEVAVMAGIERKNISQALRGGDVTVVMGSVDIDLRESRMASSEVRIGVSVVMGEAVFRIPREWAVESRVSATMANFEDRTAPPVDGASKRFVIEGSAFMGNIEIRN